MGSLGRNHGATEGQISEKRLLNQLSMPLGKQAKAGSKRAKFNGANTF
jgi:hypothetical protein